MTIRIHVTIRVLRVLLRLVEVRVSWLGHSEPLKKKKITSKSHKPNNNQDLNLQIHKPNSNQDWNLQIHKPKKFLSGSARCGVAPFQGYWHSPQTNKLRERGQLQLVKRSTNTCDSLFTQSQLLPALSSPDAREKEALECERERGRAEREIENLWSSLLALNER